MITFHTHHMVYLFPCFVVPTLHVLQFVYMVIMVCAQLSLLLRCSRYRRYVLSHEYEGEENL